MEPTERMEAIIASVEAARSVPMSSNCILNRGELLGALTGLRDELPAQIRYAEQLLAERDGVLTMGQREAERIIAEGHAERHRLVSTHEIVAGAELEAARVIEAARAEAQRLRDEVEEYVDTSLANFQQLLERTLDTVRRGQTRMTAVTGLEGGFEPEGVEKPLPF